ncbi:reverse transcriptase-like protein [Bacillus niameyensis]|uniref:reverse transcriptase-like protein n=1 Tax=Bacillus niameyensis TaxID=1522308 RepID=UPI0007842906|nr:reverse transcriptase-like protein [Bacillus niameyensis]
MIEVYIDGASAGNPGLSGAGIFIKSHHNTDNYSIPLGMMSNHEAEFSALVKSLEICLESKFQIVSVRSDSSLVVEAIEKRFVKNDIYRPFLDQALMLISNFDLFFIKWISSKENKQADQLARRAIRLNNSRSQ